MNREDVWFLLITVGLLLTIFGTAAAIYSGLMWLSGADINLTLVGSDITTVRIGESGLALVIGGVVLMLGALVVKQSECGK